MAAERGSALVAGSATSSAAAPASPPACWSSTTAAGPSETDLLGLADSLDPERRLRVVSPRGPLQLPGSPGYHWYLVPRVGHPDRETFEAARAALAELHDELWAETGMGPERTVLGGFSMGTVMSYAMGLGAERPAVAGILAFSGFVPTRRGLGAGAGRPRRHRRLHRPRQRRPGDRGRYARAARELLEGGGLGGRLPRGRVRALDRAGPRRRSGGLAGATLPG